MKKDYLKPLVELLYVSTRLSLLETLSIDNTTVEDWTDTGEL